MAGGSKQVPNQPKTDTESKSKGETQEDKEETQTESNPDADSSTKADPKGKGKKPMSPKEKSPMEAAKKGIVIGEAKEPEAGSVEKSGVKRKRESAVNSCYSLRSGLKGTGVAVGQQKVGRKSAVRKVKGKKKEKETDDVLEEGSCKRQSKRIKRNDDDKDKDGDGESVTKRALRIRAENN